MRNVVLYELLSLDGVAEEPGGWMFNVDEAVFANLGRVIHKQSDILLGRKTYEYWVGYGRRLLDDTGGLRKATLLEVDRTSSGTLLVGYRLEGLGD